MNEIPSPMTCAGDAELVAACLRGEEAAWPRLLEKYGHAIYSIPINRGLSRSEALGVFQTVCLLLASELPRLRDVSALPRWIVETTARQCTPPGLELTTDVWCSRLMEDWVRCSGPLRHDDTYAPPADASRTASTYFAADRAAADGRGSRGALTLIPALVFDMTLTASGSAERPDASDWRHLVYQAPPISIDLQLQRGRRDRLFITGRIHDLRQAERLSTSACIVVMRGDVQLVAAQSTACGEFSLEFAAADDLILEIETDRLLAQVPLDRWPTARYTN